MLIHIFKLIRPLNVIISGISVLISASLSPQFQLSTTVIFAVISAALVTSAANIVNDIFDLGIDRINKPDRILASEKISIKTAWIYYFTLNIVALIFSWMAGYFLFLIACLSVLLLFLYSYKLKGTVLMGNFTVSLVSGVAFFYGAIAVNDWQVGIIPAVFAFLFHFGREIVKDLEDIEGDLSHNAITFAGRFGKTKSILFINANFVLLLFFLFAPFVLSQFNIYYIYIVGPGVAFVVLFVSVLLWFKNDTTWLGRISLILKIDMFIGLSAIYIGAHHDLFTHY